MQDVAGRVAEWVLPSGSYALGSLAGATSWRDRWGRGHREREASPGQGSRKEGNEEEKAECWESWPELTTGPPSLSPVGVPWKELDGAKVCFDLLGALPYSQILFVPSPYR